MADHPNVALHRASHEAFGKGDVSVPAGLLTQNTVFHWKGNNQLTGEHKGPDGILGVLGNMAELTGGNLGLNVHDILGNDEHTIAMATANATRAGKSIEYRYCKVLHWSNNQITEGWLFFEDQVALDEFWA